MKTYFAITCHVPQVGSKLLCSRLLKNKDHEEFENVATPLVKGVAYIGCHIYDVTTVNSKYLVLVEQDCPHWVLKEKVYLAVSDEVPSEGNNMKCRRFERLGDGRYASTTHVTSVIVTSKKISENFYEVQTENSRYFVMV